MWWLCPTSQEALNDDKHFTSADRVVNTLDP